MQDLLLDVHSAGPTTVLLVTHDVHEALQLADRVILLGSDGDDPRSHPADRRRAGHPDQCVYAWSRLRIALAAIPAGDRTRTALGPAHWES